MGRTVVVRAEGGMAAEGTHGVLERSLVALSEVRTSFDVRYVAIPAQAAAPPHEHPWEQATYVLSGSCRVTSDQEEWALGVGDFVFFEAGVPHGFSNTSATEPVTLLAIRGPRPE